MFGYIFVLLLIFTGVSCATAPRNLDAEADSELGADQGEKVYEAQETIQAIQERNQQEQKSALQRQITDPNY